MSEIKLNLIDSQRVLHGMVHASVADRAVASLTAEPETISELELALTRFERPLSELGHFSWFTESQVIDEEPWDAGLMIIDLPARVVAVESTYSHPAEEGHVTFHNGEHMCELNIPYHLSDEWQFVYSIEHYAYLRDERVAARIANPPLDARAVLYGTPLLEFIAQESLSYANSSDGDKPKEDAEPRSTPPHPDNVQPEGSITASASCESEVDDLCQCWVRVDTRESEIHSRWLSTPRDDLRQQSPRDIILAKQNFIDFDLHSRELQWSFQNEGPPCLPVESDAYRFAAFGTQEWVIYYDLVRYLIKTALNLCDMAAGINQGPANETSSSSSQTSGAPLDHLSAHDLSTQLQQCVTLWLETPSNEYSQRTPANLIESERKRLPIAMSAREMIVDENCPICQAMAEDPEFSMSVGFSQLDGAHMDDDFVFSSFLTREEWEVDRLRWKEFNENFAREEAERNAFAHAEREARERNAENASVSSAMSAAGGEN
jgi:hypothetical protein